MLKLEIPETVIGEGTARPMLVINGTVSVAARPRVLGIDLLAHFCMAERGDT